MRQNALLRDRRRHGAQARGRETRADDRADHFAVRNGVRCAGAHLIVDLYGAAASQRHRSHRGDAARCVAAVGRDAAAHPSAPFPAQRRVRRGGAGGEPHLDPHLAGRGLRRARRVHVRQRQPGRLRPGAARGIQGEAGRGQRIAARPGPLDRCHAALTAGLGRPSTASRRRLWPGRFAFGATAMAEQRWICRNAVRRGRLPHELRGRPRALRDADRASAPGAVREPLLRQDADARRRDAGHRQGRVRLSRDDDACADPGPRQGARHPDRRRRRLRHRRGGAQAQVGASG